MEKRYLYKLLLVSVSSFLLSCNGYLEEIPQNKQKLSTTDDYDQLLNNAYLTKAVLPYIDVLTDDMDYIAADRDPRFGNVADSYLGAFMWDDKIESTLTNGDETFGTFYNSAYNANVVIDNIDDAIGSVLDEQVVRKTRNHIKGEAYALRAFRYFYLVNIYAAPYDPATCAVTPGIPINLETTADDKSYRRESLQKVYEQIVDDLKKAISLMEENSMDLAKSRFSAIAAKALLARVYLYMQEWDLAIELAKDVITTNPALFDLRAAGENPVIYTESRLTEWTEESIPGIGYLSEENTNVLFVNGINELYMILGGNTAQSVFYPSETLYSSYETGDVRRYYFMRRNTRNRIRYMKNRYYQLSYLNFVVQLSSEYGYTRVIRTEEMYLILAEAYAHKSDGIGTAVGYLNTLRETKFRTKDFETSGRLHPENFTQETLLETIWNERRREFCFEEQRWFDLRRTTRPAMTHYGLVKDPAVLEKDDPRYVLQIPQKELNVNPEIGANPR
ncbi:MULTISPECIES: RagB/SusD family nutrient uptake outer membrane protein [Odoribacteraceae]|uniref:RagB/SusD family nutrient uptake outer membrane protein n=1 Tax=Odoribacteraceae TaxID=1853231 RepID=UPI000E544022|nr:MULTISPECIES: RagB/SusD family nutrient uptake outer membrane protein [Odoribacteraceae]MCQ4872031.1 RagB/SusD family nutrient uptake outer membrane protein [Butyricimonas paravirosa]RHR80639.1 RagB/SusD family nutrient uptake outer membrane protein [Odoribacter sp. AF15-53]